MTAELPKSVRIIRAARGVWVAVCLECGMPERFHGYTVEGEIPGLVRRHGACSGEAPAPAPRVAQGQSGSLFETPAAGRGGRR